MVLAAVIGPVTLAAVYLLTMIVGPVASGDHDSGLGGPMVALMLGSGLAAVVGLRGPDQTVHAGIATTIASRSKT